MSMRKGHLVLKICKWWAVAMMNKRIYSEKLRKLWSLDNYFTLKLFFDNLKEFIISAL